MEPSTSPPKILIADDNPQNVELLEAYLSDFDCEIRTAHDGEETSMAVEEYGPGLAPAGCHDAAAIGLRGLPQDPLQPKTKDLLVLMVTALNEAADFERGVQAGTDDFLTKPVNKVELLCRIRSLFGSAISRPSSTGRSPISRSSRRPAGQGPPSFDRTDGRAGMLSSRPQGTSPPMSSPPESS